MMNLLLKSKRIFLKLLFSFLFFIFSGSAFTQNQICLSNDQMVEISKGMISEISSLLSKEKWILISNEVNIPLVIDKDSLNFNLAIWHHSAGYEEFFLYLYYRDNFSNYIEYKTNSVCYNTLLSFCETLPREFPVDRTDGMAYRQSENLLVFFTRPVQNQDVFSVFYYNKNQIDSLVAIQRELKLKEEEELRRKIALVENALNSSDALRKREQLNEALVVLEEVIGILPQYDKKIIEKSEVLKSEIKAKKIKQLTSEGEELFAKRDLHQAKAKFHEILLLDAANEVANRRLTQIKKMLEILSSRSEMMYDYKILNPDAHQYIYRHLTEEVNHYATGSPSGVMNFNLNIYFDTAGNNLSFYEIINSSVAQLSAFLSNLSQSSMLLPTKKEEILVSSKSFIPVNLNWNITEVELIKKMKKIKTNPGNAFDKNEENVVNSFLTDSLMPRGKYYFDLKRKNLNSTETFSDITLRKYKTVGPEAALYSMLLPGSGTLAATQGRRGAGALSTFLIFGTGSLLCWYYSDKIAKISEKSEQRKWLMYGSYVCVGVAGVIYVVDVINAFSKGIKNLKSSKTLRKALKKSPVEIKKESVILDL